MDVEIINKIYLKQGTFDGNVGQYFESEFQQGCIYGVLKKCGKLACLAFKGLRASNYTCRGGKYIVGI